MWKRFSDILGLHGARLAPFSSPADVERRARGHRAGSPLTSAVACPLASEFPRPPVDRGSSQAFTLIEIMLVVGIIGIVLTFGVPPMVRMLEKEPLRQAVADTVEGLSHARAQAILQGRPSEWVITGDYKISVHVTPEPTPNEPAMVGFPWMPPAEPPEEPSAAPVFEARFGEDVMITSLRINGGANLALSDLRIARVRFFPNGTSDDFEMDLQDLKHARQITLDPVTGFADVVSLR